MVYLLLPIAVMVVTQIIKLLMETVRGNFSWEHLNNYGGMPSAHAALLSSLLYLMVYLSGWESEVSIIALVLLIIVVRDATGFRQQLGLHAHLINRIIRDLPAGSSYKYPLLTERLGHTPAQVVVGIIAGVILTAIGIQLISYF